MFQKIDEMSTPNFSQIFSPLCRNVDKVGMTTEFIPILRNEQSVVPNVEEKMDMDFNVVQWLI